MWDAAELTLVIALVVVLASAGILKLNRHAPGGYRYRLLGSAELVIAAGLLLSPSRPLALGTALVLGVAFTGYAVLRPDRPCRCFGERLEVSGLARRLTRSASVAVISLFGLLAWAMSPKSAEAEQWMMTSIVLGLLIGGLAIAAPTLTWTSPATSMRRET
jgi:hypothetical protein